MGRTDPFFLYSWLLRAIIFIAIPAFLVWQYARLKRALHVFQLEGYGHDGFRAWCARNPKRARWLEGGEAKKPLVMTGRAWRLLLAALALNLLFSVLLPGLAHVWFGWPADVLTWAGVSVLLFFQTSRLLVVTDWLLAPLQGAINRRYLASARRTISRTGPVVVAVTGSYGKTSTKSAIAHLLSERDDVLVTPGSYNTPLGVARTINERMEDGHGFFVVEMGARRRGDIAELCSLVQPSVAVLTSIGPAHLETFGSIDAVRATKYEIVESLGPQGVAVMNVDDPAVRALADETSRVRVVRYGLEAAGTPRITARAIETTLRGTKMTVVDAERDETIDVEVPVLGRHAVGHVLAGVAVALVLGRRLTELAGRIRSIPRVEHRLQIIEGTGSMTIIDDAYNSNPEGAAAALEVLEAIPARRRIVVTPGMIEMGSAQQRANRRLGHRAAQVADVLIVVAEVNRESLIEGARSADGNTEVVAAGSLKEAQVALGRLVGAGDVVLFENDLPDHLEA